jgi:predicted Zn-dependent protease
VRVIAHDGVNAFAAPGGQIVIFDGLLQQAASPQVLAAVLAHEMAHVMERHPARGLIRRTGYRLLVAALVGDLSSAMGLLAESGELLLNLAHSREDEAAADRLAIGLLNAAGIDSRGLGSFFVQLHGDAQPPRLLSSHPPARRAHRSGRAALEQPGPAALEPAQWEALRGICQQPEEP